MVAELADLPRRERSGRRAGLSRPQTFRVARSELLPGCGEAAKRLFAAISARRRIVVYGDYDVDGMTGTAILWLCLKLLGRR